MHCWQNALLQRGRSRGVHTAREQCYVTADVEIQFASVQSHLLFARGLTAPSMPKTAPTTVVVRQQNARRCMRRIHACCARTARQQRPQFLAWNAVGVERNMRRAKLCFRSHPRVCFLGYLLCGCTVDGTDNDHTAGIFQKILHHGIACTVGILHAWALWLHFEFEPHSILNWNHAVHFAYVSIYQ